MEYYFYILVVVALFLKLGLYFCWYHMRRRAALAREVHIVMPDGTTRRAVVTGRTTRGRNRREEDRQILAHADTLQHSENQGFEERPAYPHVMTGNAPVGAFPEPPPYSGIIGGMEQGGEWKLPKYEDLPPPYMNSSSPPETGYNASEATTVPMPSSPSSIPVTTQSMPSYPSPVPSSPHAPPQYTISATPTDERQQPVQTPQTVTTDNYSIRSSSELQTS